MRLGIGTYAYAWAIGVPGSLPARPLDAFGMLEKARSLGVSIVQFADNLPLDRLLTAELDRFQATADEMHLAIEVGTRGIQPDHLRTYLALAKRFGSPILRVVIDTADHHPGADEVATLLSGIVPELEKSGVCLAIENHDRFPVQALVSILQRLNTPFVGVCLDTVNSFGCLEGPEMVVEALGRYVVNLHVKDFSIRRLSHNMGFLIEGTPAGKGRLDVPWLLDQLRRLGRDPNAILELWPPPEPDLEKTIIKEQAWAVESIAYLRTLIAEG